MVSRAPYRGRRIVEETRQRLDDWSERLGNSLTVGLDLRQRRLAQASGRLNVPTRKIEHEASRLEAEARALSGAIRAALRECRARLHGAAVVLESLSYQRVLERGFALVHGPDGEPISRAGQAKPGMSIGLEFNDGAVGATVDGAPSPQKPRRRPSKAPDGAQGSLL